VVGAGKFDAEFGIDFLHLGLIGIVGGTETAFCQADAGIGDKEYLLDIMTFAEVGNHIFAPAKVGFATHGGVADKEKVLFHTDNN
jgi:hypothetical protein